MSNFEKQSRAGEKIATRLEALGDALGDEWDSMPTEEFGSGTCICVAGVSIMAYEADEKLAFDVLHPADHRNRCPAGEPAGFRTPWQFNTEEVVQRIRMMADAANTLYERLGIWADEEELDVTVVERRTDPGEYDYCPKD